MLRLRREHLVTRIAEQLEEQRVALAGARREQYLFPIDVDAALGPKARDRGSGRRKAQRLGVVAQCLSGAQRGADGSGSVRESAGCGVGDSQIEQRSPSTTRGVDRYDESVAVSFGQNPLMRKYNLAYRYREFGEVVATVSPLEKPVSFSVSALFADDDYENSLVTFYEPAAFEAPDGVSFITAETDTGPEAALPRIARRRGSSGW